MDTKHLRGMRVGCFLRRHGKRHWLPPDGRSLSRGFHYLPRGVDSGDLGEPNWEAAMNEHVYKTIEITGSSHKGPEDAIRVAIEKAAQTVKNIRWFKVVETRGNIDKGKIDYWQVTLDLGFTLE